MNERQESFFWLKVLWALFVSPLYIWIDWPDVGKYTFKSSRKARPPGPNYNPRDLYYTDGPIPSQFVFEGEDGKELILTVDEENEVLQPASLFHKRKFTKDSGGPGMIGIIVFSLSIVPLWLPTIVSMSLWFGIKERYHGMPRNCYVFLKRVRKTMPLKEHARLKTLFENEWSEKGGNKWK